MEQDAIEIRNNVVSMEAASMLFEINKVQVLLAEKLKGE